jgi:PhnB protein
MQTTPFLLFNGNCAEAMRFYQQCLGGELILTKLGNTPMKEQFPVEKHERIINAQLINGDINISASDWMASPSLEPVQGNTTAIFITSKNHEELQSAFNKLSVGANQNKRTFIPLRPMPFGIYGQFTDKFSVSWIFRGEKS